MAAKRSEGMRIGPISLLTLISVLLLAVLAMLCVTTTNATKAMATRQADSTAETYLVDSCGQALLAGIDDELKSTTGTATEAVSSVDARLTELESKAKQACGGDDLVVSAKTNGDDISFTVAAESGKTLEAEVRVTDDLAYSIESWHITTTQQLPEDTLWSNSSAGSNQ